MWNDQSDSDVEEVEEGAPSADFGALARRMRHPHPAARLNAIQQIADLTRPFSRRPEDHAAIVAAGCVPLVMHMLHSQHADIQLQAAQAAQHLGMHDPAAFEACAAAEGIEAAVAMLDSQDLDAAEAATRLLGCMAFCDAAYGEEAVAAGAAAAMLRLLPDCGLGSQSVVAFFLAQLCHHPPNRAAFSAAGGVTSLTQCLDDNLAAERPAADDLGDYTIATNGVLRALADLLPPAGAKEAALAAELPATLVALLSRDCVHELEEGMYARAGKAVCNLLCDSASMPEVAAAVLEAGAVPALVGLLDWQHPDVLKCAARALGSLAQLSPEACRDILAGDCVRRLACMLSNERLDDSWHGAKARAAAASALTQIVRAGQAEAAAAVVAAGAASEVVQLLPRGVGASVSRHLNALMEAAAALLRQLASHGQRDGVAAAGAAPVLFTLSEWSRSEAVREAADDALAALPI